jgi:hypothetical protein
MYGYPTQTIQETIDSLEMVRQLFELCVLQSGFWHQFAMTAHSPVGMFPDEFGVIPELKPITFANNDIDFKDKTGINHDQFSFGLKKSLFNFMHGIGFDFPLQEWFDFKIPKTKIHPDFIANSLYDGKVDRIKSSAKIVWIGGKPITTSFNTYKKGVTYEKMKLTFHNATVTFDVLLDQDKGDWLLATLEKIAITESNSIHSLSQLKTDFETHFEDFELFLYSKSILKLRENGLLVF